MQYLTSLFFETLDRSLIIYDVKFSSVNQAGFLISFVHVLVGCGLLGSFRNETSLQDQALLVEKKCPCSCGQDLELVASQFQMFHCLYVDCNYTTV